MSPPWATTSSRFCVPCAPAGPASAEGSAAAAPATPAAFNSSRRVRPLMRHLPGECCYLRALGSGCQGRAGATIRATMRTADVVVIGGGVNGASTAFHLTTLGVRDVLLLERRHLAAGATGKSGALVRMHYTNDVESRLALESLKVFRDFGAIVGGECGFEPVGFVQLVGPEYRDALRRNVARQQALGIAAGAWAPSLLAPLGLDYGLSPFRIQVAIFRWPAGFAQRHPAVIDATRMSWFRPEGAAATLIGVELGAAHADPEKFDEGVDAAYVARCREALTARLPQFADAPMRGGWAGMIMMSPDGRPIIDRLPAAEGLWAMLGDSGTSFKTAPAIGRCLAEWITAGAPRTADLHPFRASRFVEGGPWTDADHYGGEGLTVSR